MQSSTTQNMHGEPFSSLASDATAVMTPADEAGFKIPHSNGRDSYRSTSSTGLRPVNATYAPLPQLTYHPAASGSGLLSEEAKSMHEVGGESEHVQFANYTGERYSSAPVLGLPPPPNQRQSKTWVPLPFRRWFWIPLVVFLVIAAIGLEIALHFSNKNQGFPTGQTPTANTVLHYAYTLPPVIITAALVAMWAWTDAEIKKIQPYVDLVHGDSPPHRSLLLDYTRYNNLWVWTRAAHNRHYLVALASLMVILTFSFQPLAAALLVVQDTWFQHPDLTMKNVAALGLNQDIAFSDLTSFMTGAGFAGASVMYNIPPPAFVRPPYTVAPFELPVSIATNGTAFANTTAIKTLANCVPVDVAMFKHPDGTGWTNTATDSSTQCSFAFEVDVSSRILFGSDIPVCSTIQPPQFSPVVFWYFSYVPSVRAAASFCHPTMSLWEVNVGVDIATGNVTLVQEIRPFSAFSNFSQFSGNVTGDPLNGRAYNGIMFNLTNPDRFVLARANATQLQLPAAVYQAANNSPLGFTNSFDQGALTTLSDKIYGMYLSLIARGIYFLPDDEPINVQVKTFRLRVWLSPVATHLLATALLILAFFATLVHLFHREDRRYLHLKHEPGTIASAVSIGAQTGVGEVLAGRHAEKDIKEALKDRKFRIDPTTMKIVMEGEYGYEDARSPVYRRESMLQTILYGPRRRTTGNNTPTSPRSPHEIQPQRSSKPQTPQSPRTLDLHSSLTPIIRVPRTPSTATETPPRSPNPQFPSSPLAFTSSPPSHLNND